MTLSFIQVLVVGLLAVIAVGATVCAFMLSWCAVLLSQIERNQRNPLPPIPAPPTRSRYT